MVATGPAAPPLGHTLAARVAGQLRREIAEGSLRAGMPLRQNEVATRLGVSSTPVREAFQMLERLGLVQREDCRGARVFRPSAEDLRESSEVCAVLESEAVRRATGRLAPGDLDELAGISRRMSHPGLPWDRFASLDERFHAAVATAAGNRRLADLISAERAASAA